MQAYQILFKATGLDAMRRSAQQVHRVVSQVTKEAKVQSQLFKKGLNMGFGMQQRGTNPAAASRWFERQRASTRAGAVAGTGAGALYDAAKPYYARGKSAAGAFAAGYGVSRARSHWEKVARDRNPYTAREGRERLDMFNRIEHQVKSGRGTAKMRAEFDKMSKDKDAYTASKGREYLSTLDKMEKGMGRSATALDRFAYKLTNSSGKFAKAIGDVSKTLLRLGVATTTGMAYKGFGGTVEQERFSNEFSALSREVAAVFKPLMSYATGFVKGIRKGMERMDETQQNKLLTLGVGAAALATTPGQAAAGWVGKKALEYAPAAIGMGARGAMALPGMIGQGAGMLGRGAMWAGRGLMSAGGVIGGGAMAALAVGAGAFKMRYSAEKRMEYDDAANRGDTKSLGLKGDEYGYKDQFSKIQDPQERLKAITAEQTKIARAQSADENKYGDSWWGRFKKGTRDSVRALGFGDGNDEELRNRAAILQKQKTEELNKMQGLGPDGKPLPAGGAGGADKRKVMLAQAGFAGAGSTFEELQTEALKLTVPPDQQEQQGEDTATTIINYMQKILDKLPDFNLFGSSKQTGGDGIDRGAGA